MRRQSNGHSNRRRPTVLVLDDDLGFSHYMRTFLETSGADVTVATSIAEASPLLERAEYDFVIVDVNLGPDSPGGDEFVIRNSELMKDATKVLISGFPPSRIRHLSDLDNNGIQFLQKGPGVIDQLRALIVGDEPTTNKEAKDTTPEPELIAMGLFDRSVRIVSLTPDGKYHFIDDEENLHRIVYVAPSETFALETAIEELESLVNAPNARELDFQDFFERNPDFILNDEYKSAHSHIVLTREDGFELIPDFVLEPFDQNALSDVLELKLPSSEIFVLKKNRMRFSSAVLEAAAQLREYGQFFDESRNREVIRERYGLMAYKPRMFVIIGRRGSVNAIDVRKIESDLTNLHLRTYDEVINRMKSRHDAMKRGTFRVR